MVTADRVTKVRVLGGTISITTPGGEVEPRGKTARLLAFLLSHAGHPLAVNDIIRTVWPEVHDPALIDTRQLEKLVSGLRALFGESGRAAIPQRKHDRYLFDPSAGDVWVDALDFERLARAAQASLDAGDAAQALAEAVGALGLWKSDPVVLPAEWTRLRDRHRQLRLAAAEAASGVGRFTEAAAELDGYVRDHPRDERGWELLVEAYLGADRLVQARRAASEAAGHLESDGMGPRLRALCRQMDEHVAASTTSPSMGVEGRGASIPDATRPASGLSRDRLAAPEESQESRHWGARRRHWWLAVAVAMVGTLVAWLVFPRQADVTTPPAPSPVAPTGPTDSIAFDFDSGIRQDVSGRYVLDSTTQHRGYEIANSGGALALIDHGGGKAVKFPPGCGGSTTPACPGAVIDVADAPFLNPGTKPFSFGAEVLVAPDDPPFEANVMQKGNGISRANPAPNQWKLELGHNGEARCVVVTTATTRAITATSIVRVTDGAWHKVRCTRTAASLSVEVDAADPVTVPLPADLDLTSPAEPVRFGGNNRMGAGRFTGAVDNAYYRL